MKIIIHTFSLLFLITTNGVYAQTIFPKQYESQMIVMSKKDQITKNAFNALSYEFTQCAAYYSVVRSVLKYSKVKDTSQWEIVTNKLLNTARLFNIGETVLARYKLEIDYQMETIRRKAENISILNLKFGKVCKFVVENPLDRIWFFVAQEMFKEKRISKQEMNEMASKGIPK